MFQRSPLLYIVLHIAVHSAALVDVGADLLLVWCLWSCSEAERMLSPGFLISDAHRELRSSCVFSDSLTSSPQYSIYMHVVLPLS